MPPTPKSTARIELVARLAWLAAFVAPLLLAFALLSAGGAAATPTGAPLALATQPEGEGEEEEGVGFCELAQIEFEEGWLTEAEMNAVCAEEEAETTNPESQRQAECPLRSASAHAKTRRNRLKLTIGYTTNFPTKATIQLYAGQTLVATYKRQLGRSGVLRFKKNLSTNLVRKRPQVRLKFQEGNVGCPSRRLVLFPR